MTIVDSKLLKKFVSLALKKLKGDWVVIGGTVLPLLDIDHRVTIDIDLAMLEKNHKDQTLNLMQLAEDLGLPIEAINQAGSFFLHKIPDWKLNLVLIKKSNTTAIYRPNGTLFLQLKISRLSNSDFADCIEMIKYCRKNKEQIDTSLLKRIIEKDLSLAIDEQKKERLLKLKKALDLKSV